MLGLVPSFPRSPVFFIGHLSWFGIQASAELGKTQVSFFFLTFALRFPPPILGRRRLTRLDSRTDRDIEEKEKKKKEKKEENNFICYTRSFQGWVEQHLSAVPVPKYGVIMGLYSKWLSAYTEYTHT